MSDFRSEKSDLPSELTWAQERLREDIAPRTLGTVGARIRQAAMELRWKYSRARSVWYADERVSLKPRELRDVEEVSGVQYGRQEVRDIEDIIHRADSLLDGPEADFYRPFVTAVRAMARAFDRPRASRDD